MMTLTCALVVAGVLSMLHPSTRSASVLIWSVLCVLYPVQVTILLIVAGIVYYVKKMR